MSNPDLIAVMGDASTAQLRAKILECFENRISYQIWAWTEERLPMEVLCSGAGYYIGTLCPETGGPNTRDSVEYFRTEEDAQEALTSGHFTFRLNP